MPYSVDMRTSYVGCCTVNLKGGRMLYNVGNGESWKVFLWIVDECTCRSQYRGLV